MRTREPERDKGEAGKVKLESTNLPNVQVCRAKPTCDLIKGLKGIVSRDEYFVWKAYNINKVPILSAHALMIITIFCFLLDEIIKSNSTF
jgi:hypothetical protein